MHEFVDGDISRITNRELEPMEFTQSQLSALFKTVDTATIERYEMDGTPTAKEQASKVMVGNLNGEPDIWLQYKSVSDGKVKSMTTEIPRGQPLQVFVETSGSLVGITMATSNTKGEQRYTRVVFPINAASEPIMKVMRVGVSK